MNYEIKEVEKGFTLIYRGVEVGTAKLECDAVLVAKQLDKQFLLEYHRGAKTFKIMLEHQKFKQELSDAMLRAKAEYDSQKMENK